MEDSSPSDPQIFKTNKLKIGINYDWPDFYFFGPPLFPILPNLQAIGRFTHIYKVTDDISIQYSFETISDSISFDFTNAQLIDISNNKKCNKINVDGSEWDKDHVRWITIDKGSKSYLYYTLYFKVEEECQNLIFYPGKIIINDTQYLIEPIKFNIDHNFRYVPFFSNI